MKPSEILHSQRRKDMAALGFHICEVVIGHDEPRRLLLVKYRYGREDDC